MRTLILGGTGMLGRALAAEARRRGWAALALSRAQADVVDRDQLFGWAREYRPALIINCAAFTKVDESEARPEHAMAVNGTGVAHARDAATEVGAALVQVSTDYVFDGRATVPYTEDAPTGPVQAYGASKLAGEGEALQSPQALVVRASWLFGPGGPNFASTILRLLGERAREGKPLRVIADQVGCPTYTPFLARALCELAASGARGMLHYRNREPVSWHGFASAIAAEARSPVRVEPITTAEYPLPAPRPAYSVLDVGRCEAALGRRVESWEHGLADYLDLLRRNA